MSVVLKQFKKKIWEEITPPCLAEVLKGYVKKEKGGYCIDCEKLIPGKLEKTGEVLKAVPVSPVWAGSAGQGLFCPPEPGQIAVVHFINFDAAFPFIQGFWAGEYTPADGKDNKFILTDGMGGVFEIGSGFFGILNNTQSLKSILESLIDKISAIITVGSATTQALSPSCITDLQALKVLIGQLFNK